MISLKTTLGSGDGKPPIPPGEATPGYLKFLHSRIGLSRQTDVVDFQDHPDQLRGEGNLLLLRQQGFNDILGLHVVGSLLQAIDAQSRIVLLHLVEVRAEGRQWGNWG